MIIRHDHHQSSVVGNTNNRRVSPIAAACPNAAKTKTRVLSPPQTPKQPENSSRPSSPPATRRGGKQAGRALPGERWTSVVASYSRNHPHALTPIAHVMSELSFTHTDTHVGLVIRNEEDTSCFPPTTQVQSSECLGPPRL